MIFSSFEFLVFFPIVTGLYFASPHRWRWLLLLVASCIFYMYFIPKYILILGFTIVVDYWAGIAIDASDGRRRKAYLLASLVANIGVLSIFKYYNFFTTNVEAALAGLGVHADLPLLRMILPIGLSFHTFQAMSYTIEVYRGEQKPERHFGIYALYVMFYPQLVAGPIERPQNLLHQFRQEMTFDYDRVTSGLRQMAWGFFKKVVVADHLVIGVDAVYGNPRGFGGPQLIVATVMFAIEVYADFSGYSDIALGSAKVMGFTLMTNFDRPYGRRSPSEFWRHWHISLYTWFNDYVYSPFTAAFRDWGKLAVVSGVLLTFTLSGLWHGAAWTFVLWGLLHGIGIAADMLTRRWRNRALKAKAWDAIGAVLTFAFVCFADIFFRARTVQDAFYIVTHLGDGLGLSLASAARPGVLRGWVGDGGLRALLRLTSLPGGVTLVVAVAGVAVMFGFEALMARERFRATMRMRPVLRWAGYYAVVAATALSGANTAPQPFIYFQF